MSGMLGLVRARRAAILEKLEDEFDLLCLGRPSEWRIGAAWAEAGVPVTVTAKRSETPVTRRFLLGGGQ